MNAAFTDLGRQFSLWRLSFLVLLRALVIGRFLSAQAYLWYV
jgi:hypothetical protein